MDDREKQYGTSSMLLQALFIISYPFQIGDTVKKHPIWVKFNES